MFLINFLNNSSPSFPYTLTSANKICDSSLIVIVLTPFKEHV